MTTAVVVPELGAESEIVTISSWLVTTGESVETGDRLVELLVRGVTFDVPSPEVGALAVIEAPVGSRVKTGDILGWITTENDD